MPLVPAIPFVEKVKLILAPIVCVEDPDNVRNCKVSPDEKALVKFV